MKDDQIIALAKKKGALIRTSRVDKYKAICFNESELIAFARAIADAQKEKDAKICEEDGKPNGWQSLAESINTEAACKQCADAIRTQQPE